MNTLELKENIESERNQIFESIIKNSDSAIISLSLDGYILSWNLSAETIYGYSASSMLGTNIYDSQNPYSSAENINYFESLKNGEYGIEYETCIEKPNGSKLYALVSLSPINNKDGVLIGVSEIIKNISVRKLALMRLQKVQDYMLMVIDLLPELFAIA